MKLLFCILGLLAINVDFVSGEAVESEIINGEDGPEDLGKAIPETTGKTENGDEMIEGDIAVSKAEKGQNRNAMKDPYRKWPKGSDGKVTIAFDYSSLPSKHRQAVDGAIKDYDKYSCVRWVKRTNERQYIRWIVGGGCWSYFGNQHQAGQQISLGYGCEYKGVAAHEMMHAMGFYHEQARPDRDEYVSINFHNVQSGVRSQFAICQDCTTQDLPYDYNRYSYYMSQAIDFIAQKNKTLPFWVSDRAQEWS